MTIVVNTHDAKTNLSRLLARVSVGEEIIIAKAGRPIARLAPLAGNPGQRTPGSAAGMVTISPDFDAPLPEEILQSFEQ